MSDKNACPYCGGEIKLHSYMMHSPMVTHYFAACVGDCRVMGPDVDNECDAIAAFCRPAHLHTYNPATHIVLSREAGETIDNRWSPAMGNRHVDRMASAELHAAMDDK